MDSEKLFFVIAAGVILVLAGIFAPIHIAIRLVLGGVGIVLVVGATFEAEE